MDHPTKQQLRELADQAVAQRQPTRVAPGRRGVHLSQRAWFHLARREDPHGNYEYRPEYGIATLRSM